MSITMENRDLRLIDKKHHIHPFTHHGDLHAQGTYIIESAKGIYITDDKGRTFIDGLAGLWCVNVGYGRQEIIDAVYQQMQKIAYYPSFFSSTTEPAIRLAERVAKLAPEAITHVFFSNSGSEANETALKLIRAYYKLKGISGKYKILTLNNSYHGVHLATTSMTQLPSCQVPFDLPLPGFVKVPGPYTYGSNTPLSPKEYGQWCIQETERIIAEEEPSTIAALFVEPIQGAGGVIVPPEGYLTALRQLCRKHRILFVADEVITGFGRLGDWFASNLWDLDPDFMTTAKGITSGYIPLGATLVRDEIAETLTQGGYYLAHGSTYSGHPTACAAALANLDILEKEKLIPKIRASTGPYFQKKLHELVEHPTVGEVRGFGLLGALELVPKGGKAKCNPNTPLGPKAAKIAREEGIVVRGIRDIVALSPPLVIEETEIDQLFLALRKTLDRLWD